MAANKHRFLFIGLLLGLSLFAVACDKETSDPPAFSTDPTAITTTEPAATEPVPTEPTVISNGIRGIGDVITNPFSGISSIGDPFILADGGKYYLYGTTIGNGFKCWRSDTLGSWSEVGIVLKRNTDSFGVDCYWAPEVFRYRDRYYMVYSARNAAHRMSICLASADSPEGPFTDCFGGKPLYAPDYSVIDASVFLDDDGRIYLYYSRDCSENVINGMQTSQSFGIELNADLTGTIGEPVLLATPDCDWEKQTISWKMLWNEGPCVLKHNGTYYLMYTANGYTTNAYSVGYATSSSPLGPFVKSPSNPILKGDGKYVSGTGHNNYFYSPDGTEVYTVYHCHADPSNTSGARVPAVGRLIFDEDGSLSVFGPIKLRQSLPNGENGLYKLKTGINVTLKDKDMDLTPVLTDGKAATAEKNSYVSLSSEDRICILLDTPRELTYVWVYLGAVASALPRKASLLINGEYLIKEINCGMVPLAGVFFALSTLPEGTEIRSLELSFTLAEGTDHAEIGEIELQYREE